MQRVDTSTAVTELPAQNEEGTPGYFTQGNPAGGIAATVPGQDWFNIVQEELMAIVLAAGLTPDKATTNQVLQAIQLLPAQNGGIYNLKPVVNSAANKLDIFTKSGGGAPDSNNQISIPVPDGNGFTVRTRSGAYLSGTSQIVMADAAGYWGRNSLDGEIKTAYLYAIWDGTGIVWALGGRSSLTKVSTTTTPTDLDYLLLENGSTYARSASHYCICVSRISYEYDVADTPDHTIQSGANYILLGNDPCEPPPVFHVQDARTSGSAGQTLSATTWNQRTLQTAIRNEITGASLASNQLTLPAGTYDVMASAVAHHTAIGTLFSKLRIRNITAGATLLIGPNEFGQVVNAGTTFGHAPRVEGRFVLAVQSVIELDHYTSMSAVNQNASSGENEVYADIKVWKAA